MALVAEAVVLRADESLVLSRMRVVARAAAQVNPDRMMARLGKLVLDCRVAVVAQLWLTRHQQRRVVGAVWLMAAGAVVGQEGLMLNGHVGEDSD